nr:60S ribosomal protein L34 [Tanacetum cinerariifolium]
MYQEGDESIIHDIDFEGMTVARLSKMLQATCMFLVKGIFFLVPSKELSNGLIQIKNDLDLANCIAICYKNGKVIDMFLEHHGYGLSHWIQTDIDNNDDEISDVEMEDTTGYAASDFIGEDDVVIPNRSINDSFLNKLCNESYINDFSDKPDVGESSQPCGKELKIDSYDEDVGKQFKLVDEVIYPAFDPKLPWNEMKPTLNLSFGKKGDWPYKKEKDEDELPKKDKGKRLKALRKDYKKQLLDTNPGSSVHLHVDEKDDGKIYFKRIYMCFKAMIEGWSAGCRKVIGLDGCFLKGTCRGELLTVIEDPVVAYPTDDIPTQQSKTSDTAKIIEDAIATGRLKLLDLKELQKEQKHSSLAKMVQDLVLTRHEMWMMFLLKNDVLLFEYVYAF